MAGGSSAPPPDFSNATSSSRYFRWTLLASRKRASSDGVAVEFDVELALGSGVALTLGDGDAAEVTVAEDPADTPADGAGPASELLPHAVRPEPIITSAIAVATIRRFIAAS
jgi:hypothetical protein